MITAAEIDEIFSKPPDADGIVRIEVPYDFFDALAAAARKGINSVAYFTESKPKQPPAPQPEAPSDDERFLNVVDDCIQSEVDMHENVIERLYKLARRAAEAEKSNQRLVKFIEHKNKEAAEAEMKKAAEQPPTDAAKLLERIDELAEEFRLTMTVHDLNVFYGKCRLMLFSDELKAALEFSADEQASDAEWERIDKLSDEQRRGELKEQGIDPDEVSSKIRGQVDSFLAVQAERDSWRAKAEERQELLQRQRTETAKYARDLGNERVALAKANEAWAADVDEWRAKAESAEVDGGLFILKIKKLQKAMEALTDEVAKSTAENKPMEFWINQTKSLEQERDSWRAKAEAVEDRPKIIALHQQCDDLRAKLAAAEADNAALLDTSKQAMRQWKMHAESYDCDDDKRFGERDVLEDKIYRQHKTVVDADHPGHQLLAERDSAVASVAAIKQASDWYMSHNPGPRVATNEEAFKALADIRKILADNAAAAAAPCKRCGNMREIHDFQKGLIPCPDCEAKSE